ncbi:protein kinase domain-containing protein [Tautonia plasticadhaerens]|uniref:Serine/threonine-protein kinase PrkC n=1 Tax=Tautonia plasticadhaerens TaxID=2527974 RepID=A0A518H3N3_9BACT|nr:protein kinase [Tautonia plasticadhaerens]QDV35412.1 Serine/threonine-protein kinase PrkC [Tautonia plasticadhaerens]
MATDVPDRCPTCGADLPADVPPGTCPRCFAPLEPDGPPPARDRSGESAPPVDFDGPGGLMETLPSGEGDATRGPLRDTQEGPEPPLVRPGSPGLLAPTGPPCRIRLLGEIARGGMGAILRGRDEVLGREVAVKVLLDRHRDRPDLIRRFVEEARIGGQLQHPGVVPIYELGAFDDRRPYFAMKLVEGRTLAALLAGRPSPADGLPRLLGVFEQVCQTMGYAHARGVVHRDLKPPNVMVGGFGEVQVMDWGLAKLLRRGGVTDDRPAEEVDEPESIDDAIGDGSGSDPSRAGSILGTPAYMSPEQARGEVGRLDERSDVFALGSILCEILTGQPAYAGRAADEVRRRAARGDTGEALARLGPCGADAELIALARDCLAVDPCARPRDAGVVASRLTAHLAGVQRRLREAERDRAVAEARAGAERSRRRLQLGLAASILALMALGGLATAYEVRRGHDRATRAARGLAEVGALIDRARRRPEEPGRWDEALEAIRGARDEVAGGGAGALAMLAAQRADARAGLQDAERDAQLLRRLAELRVLRAFQGLVPSEEGYAQAFRDADLDLRSLPVDEVVARLRRRPGPVVVALVPYLDDWFMMLGGGGAPGLERTLLEIGRAADPDPFRSRLRDLLLSARDRGALGAQLPALRGLATDPEADELPAPTAVLLGWALAWAGDMEGEAALLERAVVRHPDDLWINLTLGYVLTQVNRPEDALRYYTVARALRPDSAFYMAVLLRQLGRDEEAGRIYDDLGRRLPDRFEILGDHGLFLLDRGRAEEAGPVLDRAVAVKRAEIARRPDSTRLRLDLIELLARRGMLDEAIAAYREATRLGIADLVFHASFAGTMSARGRHEEALAALGEVKALDPDYGPEWVRGIERKAALAPRLPGVISGDDAPADAAEAIDFAMLAYDARAYADATRLFTEALGAGSGLGEDRRARHRSDAARCAVRAAAEASDDPAGGPAAGAELRGRALSWLRADLGRWAELLDADAPAGRLVVELSLRRWQTDPDLAPVRGPSALARLPVAERAEWRTFWSEVDRLRSDSLPSP